MKSSSGKKIAMSLLAAAAISFTAAAQNNTQNMRTPQRSRTTQHDTLNDTSNRRSDQTMKNRDRNRSKTRNNRDTNSRRTKRDRSNMDHHKMNTSDSLRP